MKTTVNLSRNSARSTRQFFDPSREFRVFRWERTNGVSPSFAVRNARNFPPEIKRGRYEFRGLRVLSRRPAFNFPRSRREVRSVSSNTSRRGERERLIKINGNTRFFFLLSICTRIFLGDTVSSVGERFPALRELVRIASPRIRWIREFRVRIYIRITVVQYLSRAHISDEANYVWRNNDTFDTFIYVILDYCIGKGVEFVRQIVPNASTLLIIAR